MRYCPNCLIKLKDYPEKENKEKRDFDGLEEIYFICLSCEKEFKKMQALNFEEWVQLKFEDYDKKLEVLEKDKLK